MSSIVTQDDRSLPMAQFKPHLLSSNSIHTRLFTHLRNTPASKFGSEIAALDSSQGGEVEMSAFRVFGVIAFLACLSQSAWAGPPRARGNDTVPEPSSIHCGELALYAPHSHASVALSASAEPTAQDWSRQAVRDINALEKAMIFLTRSAPDIATQMGRGQGLRGEALNDYIRSEIQRGYRMLQEDEQEALRRGRVPSGFTQAAANRVLGEHPNFDRDHLSELRDALYYQHAILDFIMRTEARVERDFPLTDPDVESQDPHKVFGVGKNFTLEQINKRYRALMLQYHPDRNPGDDRVDRIARNINNAHDALNAELEGRRPPSRDEGVLSQSTDSRDENIPNALDAPSSLNFARSLPPVSPERVARLLGDSRLSPLMRETLTRYENARRSGMAHDSDFFPAFVGHLEGYLYGNEPSRPPNPIHSDPHMESVARSVVLSDHQRPPQEVWDEFFPNLTMPQEWPLSQSTQDELLRQSSQQQ